MKQWEIWKFPYPTADRAHWFVIISRSVWGENPDTVSVNGLLCTTLRPSGRELKSHEVRLDAADGMDWDTVVKCSYVHELPAARAVEKRGPVASVRQRGIAVRLRACFGLG
jgi:mRNA-degrading endonuclease toxin of MazEF toxin-antitoxin module